MNEDVTRGADASDPLLTVMRYHEETKHHFSRYARSPGYMDWANQPNPFRRYQGSPLIALPLLKPDEAPRSPLYDDLYLDDVIVSAPVTIRSISRFFEYSLAIRPGSRPATCSGHFEPIRPAATCILLKVTCSSTKSPACALFPVCITTRPRSMRWNCAPSCRETALI